MLDFGYFCSSAVSKEGKLQVELAQLKYICVPRLTEKGTLCLVWAAGIGTRGPVETKLEQTSAIFSRRIDALKEQLNK